MLLARWPRSQGRGVVCSPAALLALTLCACARAPAVVSPDARLERVVVYKNGVAYFERSSAPGARHVDFVVPAERIDDLLKSLTVNDQRGRAKSVDVETVRGGAGEVKLRVALPASLGAWTVGYVTESPAWKPSYRVLLGPEGKATLQGWAIVDNTTGEDWRGVRIGVGSTAALSFRYDLHSVRNVERHLVDGGQLLASAPPVGGSPYAVGGSARVVLGSFGESELAALSGPPSAVGLPPARSPAEQLRHAAAVIAEVQRVVGRVTRSVAEARRYKDVVRTLCLHDKLVQIQAALGVASSSLGRLRQAVEHGDAPRAGHEHAILHALEKRARRLGVEADQCVGYEQAYVGGTTVTTQVDPGLPDDEFALGEGKRKAPATPPAQAAPPPPRPTLDLAALGARLKEGGKVRVVGFPLPGDADPAAAALQRAERVRQSLIERGAPPDGVEVAVGAGPSAVAVRVLEVGEPVMSIARGQSAGEALFVSRARMTIERGHSAMVAIVHAETTAERVYLYDPDSPRGSPRHAFNALHLENPGDAPLESGPITVYAAGRFLGEGMTEAVAAKDHVLVPYALDRGVVVERNVARVERVAGLLSLDRGVLRVRAYDVRVTRLVLHNRTAASTTVYVRHRVAPGYELTGQAARIGSHRLLSVQVPAKDQRQLTIEERARADRVLVASSDEGAVAIAQLLAHKRVSGKLARDLAEVLRRHGERAKLEQRIATLSDNVVLVRERVGELVSQLAALDKVPEAGRLRRHLAAKLGQLTETLQNATLALVELQGNKLGATIALQDAIAAAGVAPLPQDGRVAVQSPHGGEDL